MGDYDEWAEAHSALTRGLEAAFAAGFTDEEIEEAIENTRPSDKEYVPGPPKRKKE